MTSNLKKVDIEDYLTEDMEISSQRFCIISYILPDPSRNELQVPMLKIRGSYSSIEECSKRVNKLKVSDTDFNMYICEVGKWGGLFTDDKVSTLDNVDIEYREELLNTMMKQYLDNKTQKDEEFHKRKSELEKRARFEGTKEGQEYLKNLKEEPEVIEARLKYTDNEIKELRERIRILEEISEESKKQLEQCSEANVEANVEANSEKGKSPEITE